MDIDDWLFWLELRGTRLVVHTVHTRSHMSAFKVSIPKHWIICLAAFNKEKYFAAFLKNVMMIPL
jgi:hypothetical protein